MSKGDQFGYSPDIGKFVTRGDKTYSEHGHVFKEGDGGFFRSMPRDADSHENYADWTDEHRASVLTRSVVIPSVARMVANARNGLAPSLSRVDILALAASAKDPAERRRYRKMLKEKA